MILAFFKRVLRRDPAPILSPDQEADLEIRLAEVPLLLDCDLLDRSAGAVSQLLSEARAQIARLDVEIAERHELRRRAGLVVETLGPVLTRLDDGYDPADDARKSYNLAVETKRRRGDRHMRKPELAAAE